MKKRNMALALTVPMLLLAGCGGGSETTTAASNGGSGYHRCRDNHSSRDHHSSGDHHGSGSSYVSDRNGGYGASEGICFQGRGRRNEVRLV